MIKNMIWIPIIIFHLNDAQSFFYQNMNVSQNKSGNTSGQLPEYFNCAFFTRKMSSKSSDIDFNGKESNDFFKFKPESNFLEDSFPINTFQNNICHKQEEVISAFRWQK